MNKMKVSNTVNLSKKNNEQMRIDVTEEGVELLRLIDTGEMGVVDSIFIERERMAEVMRVLEKTVKDFNKLAHY